MAYLLSKFEDDELGLLEVSQSVGQKRKRDDGPNIIGNQHDIEEDKEEEVPPRQRRTSPRNKQKSPKPSQGKTNMKLRQGIRSITSTGNPLTGSAELVMKTADLNLRESQMRFVGEFQADKN